MAREKGRTLVAQNRRARHDYHIEDTVEAGLVLTGTEVKSLREGRASLVDGYAAEKDGEIWLHNVHIPEYTQGKTRETGLTLVPLALYFKDGYAKVEIGLARGKRSYDKRQALAEREAKRDAARAIARRGRDD